MTNKTPSGAEKHHESSEPQSSKTTKMFFFLLSSDGLAQYCVNLSRWFMHETAAFYTEQCTTPSLFHKFEVSQGARSHSLKNYGFQSLSNDTKLLLKIAEIEMRCVVN